jgi:hypothetical protein
MQAGVQVGGVGVWAGGVSESAWVGMTWREGVCAEVREQGAGMGDPHLKPDLSSTSSMTPCVYLLGMLRIMTVARASGRPLPASSRLNANCRPEGRGLGGQMGEV